MLFQPASNIQVPWMVPQFRRGRATAGGGVAYSAAVLADTPVGYWRLGESSGTTVVDSSGNSRNGSYLGGYTLGAAGATTDGNTAVSFDGVNGRVNVPHNAAFAPANLTVECWYKTTAAFGYLMTKDPDTFYLGIGDGATPNKLAVYVLGVNGANWLLDPSASNDGNWHHAAVTYNGTTLTLYRDGVSVNSLTGGPALTTGTGMLKFASRNNGGSFETYLNGSLDEPAIYNTALSAARILAHYNAR